MTPESLGLIDKKELIALVLAMAEQIIDAPETLSVLTNIAMTESELGQSKEE